MRTKKVTRHFCEHCSRGSFKRPTMERHEATCFRNPNRLCLICSPRSKDPRPVAEHVKALGEDDLPALRDACGNCPACILAAIIQSKTGAVSFNYKEEMQEWHSVNIRNFDS